MMLLVIKKCETVQILKVRKKLGSGSKISKTPELSRLSINFKLGNE